VKYVALAVVGGATGFLIARLLIPTILDGGVLFLVLPILLVATLLLARAFRRGRSGS
jgi:hypothetical protein